MKKLKKFVFVLFFALTSFVYASDCKIAHYRLDDVTNASVGAVCNYHFSHRSKYKSLRKYNNYGYQLFITGLKCNYVITANGERHEETFTVEAVYDKDCVKNQENKCSKNKGVRAIPLVPWGELKFIDLSKGLYTFKEIPPPATVCEGGCLKALSSPVQMHDEHDSFIGDVKGQSYDALIFSRFVYHGTGQECTPDDSNDATNEPDGKPDEEVIDKDQCESKGGYYGQVNGKNVCLGLENEDKNKCEAEGGYYGEVNGKKVCLGVDKKDKCLPGQTYGQINGKDVCLTPEGDALPKFKNPAGNGTGPGSGGGTGGGNGTGNGGNGTGNGTGNGQGSGSGGGGGGKGNGEGDGKGDGAGPSFGDRPGLYEPKYKNGVKGVWNEKKSQMQNSGLGRLSKRLMPTVNSGTCPKWQIDMNWGKGVNFGLLNIAPPCAIWPVLRVIVMVCALILARKLVFGG